MPILEIDTPGITHFSEPQVAAVLSEQHKSYFGRPVNSATGKVGNVSAIVLDLPPFNEPIPLVLHDVVVESITSYRELNQHLKVGVEAAYGGSGVAVKASVKLSRASKLKQSSAYFLLKAEIDSEDVVVRAIPRLRDDVVAALKEGAGWNREDYGDAWISNLTLGGALYVLFEIASHSKQDAMEIQAKFSLETSGGSVKADLKQSLSSLSEGRQLYMHYTQMGGKEVVGSLEGIDKIDTILNLIKEFHDSVGGAPAIVNWTTSSYSVASNVPNGKSADLQPALYRLVAERAALLHAKAQDLESQLEDVKRNSMAYEDVHAGVIETQLAKLVAFNGDLRETMILAETGEIDRKYFKERIAELEMDARVNVEIPVARELYKLFYVEVGQVYSVRDLTWEDNRRKKAIHIIRPTDYVLAEDESYVEVRYNLTIENYRTQRLQGQEQFHAGPVQEPRVGIVRAEFDWEVTTDAHRTIRFKSIKDSLYSPDAGAWDHLGALPLVRAWENLRGKFIPKRGR